MRRGIFLVVVLSVSLLLFSCKRSLDRLGDEAMARQDYASAIRFYMEALAERPDSQKIKESLSNARIKYARRFFLEARGGLHENIEDWEILAQHLEAEGDRYRIELLETYYSIAKKYVEKGNNNAAIDVLKKAIVIEPVRKIAIGRIFDIFTNIPDTEIENNIRTFVDENKDDVDICTKAAAFLAQRGHLAASLEIYDRCLKLVSDRPILRDQIDMEMEIVRRRKERAEDRIRHQPGQWESGEGKR